MTQEVLLKAFNITKSYDRRILNKISFEVKRGDFISIFGKSGSGKSTLLYILGGLLKPDEGEIFYNGEIIYKKKEIYRKNNIGFVFQFFHLIDSLNVYENIVLPLKLISKRENKKMIYSLSKDLGISHLLNVRCNILSGGEKQRVALARALSKFPDLLFCDEPTGNLDSQSASFVFETIKRFHDSGGTVILVTHDKDNLYGDIYNLIDGKLVEV